MARVWSWACVWAWTAVFALLFARACGRGGIKGEPRVTTQWQARKVVREGDFVKLICPITGSPEPFYEWFKDGEAVKATWNRYAPKKKILRIKPVHLEDGGAFTCVGVNGFGKVNSSMSLIVLKKGEPEGDLMEPVLTEVWPEGILQRRRGEGLVLICRARGLPTPTITWYKDDLLLNREGEQLTFSSMVPTDTGRYTCRANSALGATSANFTLQVGEPNEDHELEISEAVNTTVVEGGTTSLQCTVRTSHLPSVQWLKEIGAEEAGKEGVGAQAPNSTRQLGGRWFRRVKGAGGVVARGEGHYLSKLTISHAFPSDAGVYVCLAVNTLGFSFKEAHLTVLHRGAGKQYPPVGQKERSVNWLFLIIPAVVVVIVVAAVVMCQLRKTTPDKPVGVTPPTPVLKGDDASALTPLNPESHAHALPRPPDLVYQEVSGSYPGGSLRGGGGGGGGGGSSSGGGGGGGGGGGSGGGMIQQTAAAAGHYADHYPSPYPESYIDPAYSDPYSGDRGPTRTSDHSYARLTHPSHPSLASHTSHASSSPHLPPPYAHAHTHAHAHAHTHRHPQYFVHYNL